LVEPFKQLSQADAELFESIAQDTVVKFDLLEYIKQMYSIETKKMHF